MLKYFQTQEALIASLLRLKDNQCHVVESEKILKSRHKYLELILLYESKGMHKEGKKYFKIINFIKFSVCSLRIPSG